MKSILSSSVQGRLAESHAEELFKTSRDCRLVARNFKFKGGEIDLIFEERVGTSIELVFVEVRSRSASSWVNALETVDAAKRLRIHRTAQMFLARYRGPAQGIRFDVMAWDGEWKHWVDAWRE
jgi:putative endonuclease